MRSDPRRFAWPLAALLVAATALPAAAQELSVVNATPGPEYGTAPGNGLSLPTDVAVGAEGVVYVVDSGRHRVARYNASGSPLGYFASEGKGEGQLQGPVGIAADNNGNIYVADRGNKRVQVFAADGSFSRSLEAEENEAPATPVDVAVSANGRSLFITANNSHRVLSLDRKGTVQAGWGGEGKEPGQFQYPASLALDAAGNLLVTDVLNFRVQVFDSQGTPTAEFGALGAKQGSFIRPKGVAVGNDGRVYVGDSYLGVVQVFTAAREYSGVLGIAGEPVRFEAPTGLAFAGGRLYVTDMLGGKVRSFEVEGAQ